MRNSVKLIIILTLFAFTHQNKLMAINTIITKPATELKPNENTKYRLVVSFISKGAGAKSNKREELINFVKKHKKQPKYTMIAWGREGETDFCFELTELNKKEQTKFVKSVKKMMKDSDLVIIYENTENPNKGRVISLD